MELPPETLHFTIGKNKEAEDWYYAQTKPGTWHLHFNLDQVPASPCRLIIAIAGACKGFMGDRENPILQVLMNGEHVSDTVLVNDSSIYRSATLSGRYRRIVVPISPSLLKAGENTIALQNDNGMIMYDTILLAEML